MNIDTGRVAESPKPAAHGGRPILAGIQLLRGCAALLVVIAHDNLMMRYPRYFQESPLPIADAGVFGVNVFFVISGFIIAYVSLDRDMKPKLEIGDYAWRRFVRIVPFMWLCVIGYNILTFLGTREVEWAAAARAMVIWPVGELKPNVLWSLRHEFLFYAIFALTMLGRRRLMPLLILWLVAPLIYGSLLILTDGAAAPNDPVLADLLKTIFMGGENGANLQFLAGFVLGLLRLKDSDIVKPRLPAGLLLTLAALLAATVLVESSHLERSLGRSILWTLLPFGIVWMGLVSLPSNGWLAKFGTMLGDASFSIYLVHNGVLLAMFEATRGLRDVVPHWLLFVLFAVGAVAVGIVVHRLVEAPLIRWLSPRIRLAPWRWPARRFQ